MKILFVSESVWEEGVVYDLHILAESLSLRGHKVYALDPGQPTSKDNTPEAFKKVARVFENTNVNLRSPMLPTSWEHENIIKLRKFNKTRKVLKAIKLHKVVKLSRMIKAIKDLFLKNGRYRILAEELEGLVSTIGIDVIVLYSAVRIGRQTVEIAKKHKIPVIFRNVDMLHELWPSAIERFIAKQSEKHVYRRVNQLCALTPTYADYLVKLRAKKDNIDLLLFPIDTAVFRPYIDTSLLRQKWAISEKDEVLVFMGSLYPFGGLIEFLYEAVGLMTEMPKIKILIVGDGVIKDELNAIAIKFNLKDRVIITGYEPFNLMPIYINLSTICFNVFPTNKRTKDIFSAKILQYLACGKTTVSTAMPGLTTLLPETSTGIVYALSIKELVQKIKVLIQQKNRREALEHMGRSYVEKQHHQDMVVTQFERLLHTMVEPKKLSSQPQNSIHQLASVCSSEIGK